MGGDGDSSPGIRVRFYLDFSVDFLLKVGLVFCRHGEMLEGTSKINKHSV